MTKLPSSNKVVKILKQHGFYLRSQRGSHQKYANNSKTVIVPVNKKEIPLGTLKSISRQSGIDYIEFINL